MSLFDQISKQHYSSPPVGWATKRIKFLADVQTSNVDKVTADDEEPVRLCNYTDVYNHDRITPDLPFMEATATPKEIDNFTLKSGQVIITKDSEAWNDIGIPALVIEDMPGTLCGYHLAIFTPDNEQIDGGFLAWLCRADALNDQFKLSANGVTRFGLGHYAMKNAVIGFPSLKTQRRITAFLDEKTAQIDGLIAKKQALLDQLAEKRQAIIIQAVTKGLNPAAPMKESGINWLGHIPAHWETFLIKRKYGVSYGVGGEIDRSIEAGTNLLSLPNISKDGRLVLEDVQFTENEDTSLLLEPGDLLFNWRNGSAQHLGKTALFDLPGKWTHVSFLLRIRAIEANACTPFLRYFLNGMRETGFFAFAKAGVNNTFNLFELRNLVMAAPPTRSEQESIANQIETEVSKLDAASEVLDGSINRLVEYRSALITAAVTGQIEELR